MNLNLHKAPFSFLLIRESLVLVAIVTLTLIPRIWLLIDTLAYGISVDEFQGIVHAYLPLDQLVKSVTTFDPHPPLFHIQLHFWMLAGNTGDIWLKLNPVFWALLTSLSIFWVAKQIFGFNVGALASILYALSPYAITESQSVRMYTMMACFGIWVFYFTHQFISKNQSFLTGTGVFISTLAFLYVQGAGFLILSSSISYAILLAWQVHARKSVLIKWGIMQLILVALYIPWVIHASSISLGHTLIPDGTDILYTFSQMLYGDYIGLSAHLNLIYPISGITMFCVIFGLTLHKNSRLLVISFIILPIAACFIFSYIVKPIWLTRTLIHIVPFISIGIAIIAAAAVEKLKTIEVNSKKIVHFGYGMLAAAFIITTLVGGLYQQRLYIPWSNLLEPVQLVQAKAAPSDVIYIPYERVYWGWCWYFIGPGSVNPLTTNYDNSFKDIRIVSGPLTRFPIEGVKTYWVVYRAYNGDIKDFLNKLPGYTREVAGTYSDVIVEKITIN